MDDYWNRRSVLFGLGTSIGAVGMLGTDQLLRHQRHNHTDDIISILGIGYQPREIDPGGTVDANVSFTNSSTETWNVSLEYTVSGPSSAGFIDPQADVKTILGPGEAIDRTYSIDVPETAKPGRYTGTVSITRATNSFDDKPPERIAENVVHNSLTGDFEVPRGESPTAQTRQQMSSMPVFPASTSHSLDATRVNAVAAPQERVVNSPSIDTLNLDSAVNLTGEVLDLFFDTIWHPGAWYHGSTKGFAQAFHDTIESLGETVSTAITLLTNPNKIVPVIEKVIREIIAQPWRTLVPSIEKILADLERKMRSDLPTSYGSNQANAFDFGWSTGYLLFYLLLMAASTLASMKLANAARQLVMKSDLIGDTATDLITNGIASGGAMSIIASHGRKRVLDILDRLYEPKVMFQARELVGHANDRLGNVNIGISSHDKGRFAELVQAVSLTQTVPERSLIPVHKLTPSDLSEGEYVVTGLDLLDERKHQIGEFDTLLIRVRSDNPDPSDVEIEKTLGVTTQGPGGRTVEEAREKLEQTVERAANSEIQLPRRDRDQLDDEFILTRNHFGNIQGDDTKLGIVGPKGSNYPLQLPFTRDQYNAIWEYHKQVANVLNPTKTNN